MPLFVCRDDCSRTALTGDRQQEGTMGPIISSTSFLYRGMARMITRAPVRYLSTFIISLAASTAGYGQGPALGVVSNPGKDSRGSAAEVRVADTSGAPENWISSYVDPVQGSSSIDLARRALQSNAQLVASELESGGVG